MKKLLKYGVASLSLATLGVVTTATDVPFIGATIVKADEQNTSIVYVRYIGSDPQDYTFYERIDEKSYFDVPNGQPYRVEFPDFAGYTFDSWLPATELDTAFNGGGSTQFAEFIPEGGIHGIFAFYNKEPLDPAPAPADPKPAAPAPVDPKPAAPAPANPKPTTPATPPTDNSGGESPTTPTDNGSDGTLVGAEENAVNKRYGMTVYEIIDGVSYQRTSTGRLTSPPKPEDFYDSERVENVVIEFKSEISTDQIEWYDVIIYIKSTSAPAPADPKSTPPTTPPTDNSGGTDVQDQTSPADNNTGGGTGAETTTPPTDSSTGGTGTDAQTPPAENSDQGSGSESQTPPSDDEGNTSVTPPVTNAGTPAVTPPTIPVSVTFPENPTLTPSIPANADQVATTRNQLLAQVDKSRLTHEQKGELAVNIAFAETAEELNKLKAELTSLTANQSAPAPARQPATADNPAPSAAKTLPTTGELSTETLTAMGVSLVLLSLGLARARKTK